MKKGICLALLLVSTVLIHTPAYAWETETEAVGSSWIISPNAEIDVTGQEQIPFDIVYDNAGDWFSAIVWDIELFVDSSELAPVFNPNQPTPPDFVPYGYAVDYSYEDTAGNSFGGAMTDLGILEGDIFRIAGLSFDEVWIAPGQNTMATITFDILSPDALNSSVEADVSFIPNDPTGDRPNQGFYQADDNLIWLGEESTLNPDIGSGVGDAQGPAVSNLAVSSNDFPQGTTSIVLTATADDSGAGNSDLFMAQYFVGTAGTPGAGTAMSAADGTFDSAAENVTATIDVSGWTAADSPYSLVVSAQDEQGNWGSTQTIEVRVTAPADGPVPTPLITPSRNKRPVFDWSDVAGTATYEHVVSANADYSFPIIQKIDLTESGYATAEGLSDGTYYWRVRAVDTGENAGEWAAGNAFSIDTTPPALVTGLTVTPQPTGDLTLAWTHPAQDYAGVLVLGHSGSAVSFSPSDGVAYSAGDQSGTVLAAIDGYSYTDSVEHGATRHYAIYAFDALYNYSAVAAASATSSDTLAPSAVSGLTAVPGNAKATLNWTNPPESDAAGVLIVYRQGAAPTGAPTADTVYAVNDAIGDGTVGFVGTGATATISGLTNDLTYYFKVFAYDERPNYALSADTMTTPVSFAIVQPELPLNVQAGAVIEFDAACSASGNYQWTFSAGTPAVADTQQVSWTAPESLTASPTAVSITVTDPDTAGVETSGTVHVYEQVEITNKPSDTPTLTPGIASARYQVEGGDGTTYAWTLADPDGQVIDQLADSASYSFTVPAGDYVAGAYTVTVTDGLGFADSFAVLVPLALDPQYFTLVEDETLDIVILGAAEGVGFSVAAVDADGRAVAFSQTDADPTGNGRMAADGNVLHYTPDDIDAIVEFTLAITADDADLVDVGLETLESDLYRVIPLKTHAGRIIETVDADMVPVEGAFVNVIAFDPDGDAAASVYTDADGYFEIDLPATGANYQFMVSKDGYVGKVFSDADLDANNEITISRTSGQALFVSGAVNLDTDAPEALVSLLIDGEIVATRITDAGRFRFDSEDDPAADYRLTAVSDDAYAELVVSGPLPIDGVDMDLTAGAVGLVTLTVNYTVAYAETDYTYGSRLLVEITADDGTGPVTAFSNGLVLTLPFDLGRIAPGSFESGDASVYHAATREALLAGNGEAVPVVAILAVDYLGDGQTGQVTFRVDSLSFFGVGVGAGNDLGDNNGDNTDTGGGGGGCFIGSAAGNAGMGPWAVTLVVAILAVACIRVHIMRQITD